MMGSLVLNIFDLQSAESTAFSFQSFQCGH